MSKDHLYGQTYCSETKWVCVIYDAAIDFLFMIRALITFL